MRECPHGRGVFALRDFLEGDVVATVVGGEYTSQPKSNGYALRLGEDLYWDEAPREAQGFWSNFLDHSSDPNCRFQDFEPSLPGARLVATRKIKSGEEMFLDYREYHPDNPIF